MRTNPDSLHRVLVTDCGSTTTKALLFEKTSEGWRQTWRGEAPTTVEEPVADVTVGAMNAFEEVSELSGRVLIAPGVADTDSPFLISKDGADPAGIDLYLSTSSAGGGLQMVVAGVVRQMTTESAQRAALGAGAIVLEALSADDGREDHERIERIRHLKPDIVLLTGGVDGGASTHVIDNAEMLLAAAPRPRFGDTLKLPVIYAGNSEAADEVVRILKDLAQVHVVGNVRPTLEGENLGPAREAIHEMFLTHVMSHSPGYGKLLAWSPVPVMPTPAAVGNIVQRYAEKNDLQVLCADIGGATTDVFSVFKDHDGKQIFNRTVSANLGMSYSIANVLLESGVEGIERWLGFELSRQQLRDRLRNKMIRPTSIPQTKEDLWLEQAVCREALRLSLNHHRALAVGLSGIQRQRSISDVFTQSGNRYQLVKLLALDVVIGSGGVLSHAPRRLEAALMMLDGFELEGLTEIAVDSIFMMPHLGVFSEVHPAAAEAIFMRDCLVPICHSVVPVGNTRVPVGEPLARVSIDDRAVGLVRSGKVDHLAWEGGKGVVIKIEPAASGIEIGAGPGKVLERQVVTGAEGFIFDGRGRPIEHAPTPSARRAVQSEILKTFKL